jgi:virulence factor Mce-like protein
MRRALAAGVLTAAVIVGVIALASSGGGGSDPSYKIEFDNAFGLVTGADFKVAGVPAGSITAINLDRHNLRAVVTVSVNQAGFGQFHTSVSCQTAPESLIGEYFVNCDPGTSGPILKPGATIPVTHTQSTVPADLLQDIMRVPVRQRLPLLIDGLGAGVAANSGNIQAALQRAIPALDETDNLLALLAQNSHTLQTLTVNADQVITALADNSTKVQNFIQYADRAAVDTATQQQNLAGTLARLPGFLTQLRPAMAKLDTAARTYEPVLASLNASAAELHRLFVDLPGFSRASLPALRALGKASVVGRQAVTIAGPTIHQLNQFAVHTPELSQNLAIVGQHLDSRSYAVEKNPASPGGQGYTGLEALLQFAFNLAAATNYYGPYGHMLGVDGFLSAMCTPYATAQSVADNLKSFGSAYRQCYSWLGPDQPGVNTTDPSDPSACVPDPGGAPPGHTAPAGSACKLAAARSASSPVRVLGARRGEHGARSAAHAGSRRTGAGGRTGLAGATSTGADSAGTGAAAGGAGSSAGGALGGALGRVVSALGGGAAGSGSTQSGSTQSASGRAPGGIQQLLNYLISP